jgi:hypothetical protein
MALVILIAALVIVDALALLYGADSRDHRAEHPLAGLGPTPR